MMPRTLGQNEYMDPIPIGCPLLQGLCETLLGQRFHKQHMCLKILPGLNMPSLGTSFHLYETFYKLLKIILMHKTNNFHLPADYLYAKQVLLLFWSIENQQPLSHRSNKQCPVKSMQVCIIVQMWIIVCFIDHHSTTFSSSLAWWQTVSSLICPRTRNHFPLFIHLHLFVVLSPK